MGRLRAASERSGVGLPEGGSRLREGDLEALLDLARSRDPGQRQLAVRNLCTCHLRADNVGEALIPMLADEDPRVRREVLHALTDSAPTARIPAVVAALEPPWNDPDVEFRRRVRRILGHYRRTGKVTDAPT